jgi:hypothetical protein
VRLPTFYLPWLPVYRGYNKALFIHDVTNVVTMITNAIVLLQLPLLLHKLLLQLKSQSGFQCRTIDADRR